jgi:RNA-directed DNA polymerase
MPVLQKYSINHGDVDFAKFQVEHSEMYPWVTWSQRLRIYIVICWTRHFLSGFLIFMTAFATVPRRRLSHSPHVVSYADDFVILSRGHADEALTWTKAVMTKLGLTLNETKTSVKDARREGFDSLGYTLGPRHLPNGGRWYLGASPSKKSVRRIKTKVGELLTPGNKGAWPEVRTRLNRLLYGWSAYFSYGALASAYEAVDQHVYDRARNFLRKRHKVQGHGADQFSREYVYGELAVRCLRRERGRSPSWALR